MRLHDRPFHPGLGVVLPSGDPEHGAQQPDNSKGSLQKFRPHPAIMPTPRYPSTFRCKSLWKTPREAWGEESENDGRVKVDETYFGGKCRNMSNAQRRALKDTGRSAVGKTAVVGIKDRDTNEVRAEVVTKTDAETLQDCVAENTEADAMVFTDDATAYKGV